LAEPVAKPFFNRRAQGKGEKEMIRLLTLTVGRLAGEGFLETVLLGRSRQLFLRIAKLKPMALETASVTAQGRILALRGKGTGSLKKTLNLPNEVLWRRQRSEDETVNHFGVAPGAGISFQEGMRIRPRGPLRQFLSFMVGMMVGMINFGQKNRDSQIM
jgi:hypothetical protein